LTRTQLEKKAAWKKNIYQILQQKKYRLGATGTFSEGRLDCGMGPKQNGAGVRRRGNLRIRLLVSESPCKHRKKQAASESIERGTRRWRERRGVGQEGKRGARAEKRDPRSCP